MTTIQNRQKFVTPVGDIVMMAVARPLTSKYSDKPEYVIKLDFNEADEGVAEFKAILEEINENKIVTKVKDAETGKKVSLPEGVFRVAFKSVIKPTVVDAAGNVMTDIPSFFSDKDTGTASAVAVALTSGVYGTALLSSVRITSLELGEREGADAGGAADFLAQIEKEATTAELSK